MTFYKRTLHMRECARAHTPAACGPEELRHNLLKFPAPNVLPVDGYQLRQDQGTTAGAAAVTNLCAAESSSEGHTDTRCNAKSGRQRHTPHT